MRKQVFAYLSLLLVFIPVLLKAQDAHYWSSDFSPGGFLTPGAAVANTRDSGIVFYNPAIMAWSDKTATSISSNVYRFDHIRIKDGVGGGKDLVSNSTKIVPQMISKTLKLDKDNPITFGFALIQNPIQDFETSQRMDKKINVLDDSYSPGEEVYVGQFEQQVQTTETYGQLSAGKRISKKLAVGITAEGMIRKAIASGNATSRALFNTVNYPDVIFPPVARFEFSSRTDYTYVGLRLKMGLSYDSGQHHWGVLLSSPLARIYSKGAVISDVNIDNLIIDNSVISPLNILASTRQTNLKANWKMPFSLSAGYAYDYGKGQIYIASEFFAAVNTYTILKANDALFIKTGAGVPEEDAGSLNLTDSRKSVLNVGLGYSRQMNEAFTLMASVRTDFNYQNATTKEDYMGGISTWDNYHAQLGGNFKRRKFNLRAGLLLTYGHTNNFEQPINFDTVSDMNSLEGNTLMVPARQFTAGLLLSYIYNF